MLFPVFKTAAVPGSPEKIFRTVGNHFSIGRCVVFTLGRWGVHDLTAMIRRQYSRVLFKGVVQKPAHFGRVVLGSFSRYFPPEMRIHRYFVIMKRGCIGGIVLVQCFCKGGFLSVDLHRSLAGGPQTTSHLFGFCDCFGRSLEPYFFLFRRFFFAPSAAPDPFFQVFAAAFKEALYEPPCFLWYALTWAIQADAPIVSFY